MYVIKNNQRPVQQSNCDADKIKISNMICFYPSLVVLLLTLLTFSLMLFNAGRVAAATIEVPLRPIAQMTFDDDGNALNYPNYVFFDPVEEEIYLTNGGSNRIVVYGADFFPRISIGKGRGLRAPQGGTVLPNGDVYICQARSYRNRRPSITILNGAFFVEREIFLDEIPEIADSTPRQLAVSSDGLIYLTGTDYRGVVVLDNDGNFLRRLEPMDQILVKTKNKEWGKKPDEEVRGDDEEVRGNEEEVREDEEVKAEEDLYLQIPEEFRPISSGQVGESGYREVLGPVKIINVTIDKKGNLYLLSLETGKIYVYGPDESFLFSFGTKGGSPRQLSQPKSLAIDEEQGLIYVADYMRHTILTYNMEGKFLFEFGGRGFGPGYFNFPNAIDLNNYGQLIVADLFNKRVQVLEVGYKEISIFLDDSAAEIPPENSDTVESLEQDGLTPEQSENLLDQENAPDPSLEQIYQTIKEEKEAEEEIITKEVLEEESIQNFEFPEQLEATEELPDHIAAEAFIRSWAEAWEHQDIEAYLTHYSTNFSPAEGLSIVEWEIARHKALGTPKFIKIDIRDMQIEKLNDSSAKATFIQSYQSDFHADEVIKTMELTWENGGWLIVKEDSKAL